MRSFLAEPETYRIFENKGRQYIAITSKQTGKRVVIPLTGQGKIAGQVRVVLDFGKQRVEIHHLVESKIKPSTKCRKLGIDLGVSEVFVDSDRHVFGKKFGKTTAKYSEAVKDKTLLILACVFRLSFHRQSAPMLTGHIQYVFPTGK
jgi:hypothetical protein